MIDCLILGDSLAVGVGQIRTECVTYAKSGINSRDYIQKYQGPFDAKSVIISLGSNDYATMTDASIRTLRERMPPGQIVYWILPNIKDPIRKIITKVATENNDVILDARNYKTSPDSVHPTYTGYKEIATDLRKKEKNATFSTNGH
jgi:lysophospholipase L1-like esterase